MGNFNSSPAPNQVYVHQEKTPCSTSFPLQTHDQRLLAFITPAEYRELMSGVNEAINRHHLCSSGKGMVSLAILIGSCGLVFCPLICVACAIQDSVRSDMERLPVVQQLRAKGIQMVWYWFF